MKILIIGAGKMGNFFCDVLSREHEVAIYDIEAERLRFTFNALRFTTMDEIREFQPELMINAEFYATCGHPFVSTHPMFGPTFASLNNLSNENAIIISESDHLGKVFFRDLYNQLHLHVCEYTFEQHDETISYSLSIPFASTLVFASIMKHQDAPGTTFKRHMAIARGLMSEDDYLLQEILFNPRTSRQLDKIKSQLDRLQRIIDHKDEHAMKQYLNEVRQNLK